MEVIQVPEHHTKSEFQVPIHTHQSDHQHIDLMKGKKWWVSVAICITCVIIGQSTAKILQTRYYENGGNTIWLRALVKTGAFPLLILPLLLFYSITPKNTPTINNNNNINISIDKPSKNFTLFLIYSSLGVLFAAQIMLLSLGIKNTSLFIFSFLSISQLLFTVLFYFLINQRKFTRWIVISIVLVFISSALVAIFMFSFEGKPEDSYSNHTNFVGYLCTLLGSITFSLYLSIMQLSFEKFIISKNQQKGGRFGFVFVFKMQIYISIVSTIICLIGFLVSEVNDVKNEYDRYEKGKSSYVLTLVGASLAWQIGLVGVVGLVCLVSCLFSNIVTMLPLSFITIVATVYYDRSYKGGDSLEHTNVFDIVGMVLAFLGFVSYIYGLYRDRQV